MRHERAWAENTMQRGRWKMLPCTQGVSVDFQVPRVSPLHVTPTVPKSKAAVWLQKYNLDLDPFVWQHEDLFPEGVK